MDGKEQITSTAGAEMFLQTERMVLRRFRPEDLDDFRVFAMDDERNRMIGNPPVNGEEDLLDFFRYMKDEEPRAYAIVLKETGRVIGNLTVYEESSLSDEGALAGLTGRELSFSLAKPYRRQGFAAEAVRAVTAHLFAAEGADYVTDGYFDFNVPSRRLHEKLGFSYLTTEQVPGPEGTSRSLIFCILRRGEG